MNFTSNIFIYFFLPSFISLFLALNFLETKFTVLKKLRILDLLTIFASLAFYVWAGITNIVFLLGLIVIGYVLGFLINKSREVGENKQQITTKKNYTTFLLTAIGVGAMVTYLYLCKYAGSFGPQLGFVSSKSIIVPLGISFISFSVISYLLDIYHGCKCGNIIDCALYISFFSKIISGPIILWKEFQTKLSERNVTLEKVSDGICEIIIGLSKKVIIADYFGSVIALIQRNSGLNTDIPTAWLICILYMFQIYYDFSGYSDVAIGLGRITGIEFEDNFNFPYVSTSITEFWRRWHMSLGNWLKTYLYIPMGGNRKGQKRTLIHLFFVMLISGIWHGAGWAYFLWGAVHGACMVIEKAVNNKWSKNLPRLLKWGLTMFIVMMGWELFRLGDLTKFIDFTNVLFGVNKPSNITFTYEYYCSPKLIVILLIAFFGATVLSRIQKLRKIESVCDTKTFLGVKYFVSLVLLIVTLVHITNSTYSPFIYFQF